MVPITATQDGSGRGALRGRTALITGSTGGIGLAVALALAAEGCDILLHGLATDEEAAPALAAVERLGVQAWYHRVELADPAAIAALVAEAGAPDILVNNAAARHFGPVEDTPPEAWDADIAVNLTAAFHLVRQTTFGSTVKVMPSLSSRPVFGRP